MRKIMAIKLGNILIRLKMVYKILFKNSHIILIDVDRENLVKILKDEDFEAKYSYAKLQPYLIAKIFDGLSNMHDDVDLILMKAEFQAKSEEYHKENKL